MMISVQPEMNQESYINYEQFTEENFLQLFSLLKENKGLKLTISFGDDSQNMVVSQKPEIGRYLTRLGIGRHLNGFSYLKTGIRHCLDHPEEMESVTKILYPAIAKEHNTTAGRVEHGIRHAISLAWEERNTEEWIRVFGYRAASAQGKPTNTEFLAALADYIVLEWGV
ncbi:MAG: sporulation initiation factor Spo0A C-terminal domain-containing protein [Lachnospiraceae bacterium]|nr:sporulation initiation factor Spo0A C-terminal domain-containing protein [Lachnospiraceae bacterium]